MEELTLIDLLTNDEWCTIFDFLQPRDFLCISLVNRKFHSLIFNRDNHYYVWRRTISHYRGAFIKDKLTGAGISANKVKKQPPSSLLYTRKNYCASFEDRLYKRVQELTFDWSIRKDGAVNSLFHPYSALEEVFREHTLHFDSSTMDHNRDLLKQLKGQSLVSMHSRRVKNEFDSHRSKWETVHANIQCTPGKVYEWSVVLDYYNPNQNSNFWVVILGVQDENLQFQRINDQVFGDWLARSGNGLGYILHCREWISGNMSYSYPKTNKKCVIKTGDVFSFRLDMVNSSETQDELISEILSSKSQPLYTLQDIQTELKEYIKQRPELNSLGGSLEMFYNGEPMLDEPIMGIMGQKLWPTISIVDQQEVSIWPGILSPTEEKKRRNGEGAIGQPSTPSKSDLH